jgi:cytochrome c-type biogenesis protein CcmH/NrfF
MLGSQYDTCAPPMATRYGQFVTLRPKTSVIHFMPSELTWLDAEFG